jgi:hypothetical protein
MEKPIELDPVEQAARNAWVKSVMAEPNYGRASVKNQGIYWQFYKQGFTDAEKLYNKSTGEDIKRES